LAQERGTAPQSLLLTGAVGIPGNGRLRHLQSTEKNQENFASKSIFDREHVCVVFILTLAISEFHFAHRKL